MMWLKRLNDQAEVPQLVSGRVETGNPVPQTPKFAYIGDVCLHHYLVPSVPPSPIPTCPHLRLLRLQSGKNRNYGQEMFSNVYTNYFL